MTAYAQKAFNSKAKTGFGDLESGDLQGRNNKNNNNNINYALHLHAHLSSTRKGPGLLLKKIPQVGIHQR